MTTDENGYLWTYRGVVYPWHCDHMGHMNVMWYTGKLDEATWNLLAACGITAEYMRDEQRGMAAVQQNITYRQELLAGDLVSIRSRIVEVRERVIRFQHELFRNDGKDVAALCELTAVHMNTTTRRACAMPGAIAERLRAASGVDKFV